MGWRGLLIAGMLGMSISVASVAAPPAPIETAALQPYRLGAGDEIRVTVFGLDALTNTYLVGDSGNISLPLLPTVAAGGKTVEELQDMIGAAIREKDLVRNPSVSVQVQKYRPFFILGEVQNPGSYPYVPGMSVMTAVSIAGGYTFRAEKKRAQITRPVDNKVVKGGAVPQTPVLPGDTVYIDEAWF